MAIPQVSIRAAKGTVYESRNFSTKYAAKAANLQTAFLCHSHKDQDLALAVQDYLWKNGWHVYIDWQDTTMPETPNRETADKIQNRIKDNNLFLFLATVNSMSSRWCPWEIGYADSAKGKDKVLIIPTSDSAGSYGNEYLELYRRIDLSREGRVVRFMQGSYFNYDELSKI